MTERAKRWSDTMEQLLKRAIRHTKTEVATEILDGPPQSMEFHALWLDDGQVWDVINGYRYK